jgi:hypothetical protein
MCDLCDENTRNSALRGHIMRAEQLERMAAVERSIAAQRIKPHTPEMSAIKPTAEALIRYLVEDYL